MVRPLKVSAPLLAMVHPVPLIVIVPAVGASVCDEFTVRVPDTPKFAVGWTVGVTAIVNAEKVSVPEFDIVQAALFIVIVPLDGVNVPVTVKSPFTVAVLLALVIEPLILRFV